jgi:hypothetical protein
LADRYQKVAGHDAGLGGAGQSRRV